MTLLTAMSHASKTARPRRAQPPVAVCDPADVRIAVTLVFEAAQRSRIVSELPGLVDRVYTVREATRLVAAHAGSPTRRRPSSSPLPPDARVRRARGRRRPDLCRMRVAACRRLLGRVEEVADLLGAALLGPIGGRAPSPGPCPRPAARRIRSRTARPGQARPRDATGDRGADPVQPLQRAGQAVLLRRLCQLPDGQQHPVSVVVISSASATLRTGGCRPRPGRPAAGAVPDGRGPGGGEQLGRVGRMVPGADDPEVGLGGVDARLVLLAGRRSDHGESRRRTSCRWKV